MEQDRTSDENDAPLRRLPGSTFFTKDPKKKVILETSKNNHNEASNNSQNGAKSMPTLIQNQYQI